VFKGKKQEKNLLISALHPNGPAERNGKLQVGDVLHSVNDVLVTGLEYEDLAQLILGQEGTPVKVKVLRNDVMYETVVNRGFTTSPPVTTTKSSLFGRASLTNSTALPGKGTYSYQSPNALSVVKASPTFSPTSPSMSAPTIASNGSPASTGPRGGMYSWIDS